MLYAQDATNHGLRSIVLQQILRSNWFVQANVAGSAFWGNQEEGTVSLRAHSRGLFNPGFSVAVGKWFTPGLGLRTKFNGAWGRTVVSEDKKTNANKYWTLNEQILFNLSNMFCGYNEARKRIASLRMLVVWNRNMSANCYSPVAGVGLLNEFKINNKWAINLDVNYTLGGNDYDGATELLDGAKKSFFSLFEQDCCKTRPCFEC